MSGPCHVYVSHLSSISSLLLRQASDWTMSSGSEPSQDPAGNSPATGPDRAAQNMDMNPFLSHYFNQLCVGQQPFVDNYWQNLVHPIPIGTNFGVASNLNGMSPTVALPYNHQMNPDQNIMKNQISKEKANERKARKEKENQVNAGDAHQTPPLSVADGRAAQEPQMSTPDDPVIHSPPSLSGQLINGGVAKMEEGLGNCTSPDGSGDTAADAEARRRQKTCRVCGDHATGYNFNVITCESCKAFFRRNALRPKEFKCPYSEDCEINAVSRRFCQKCRLRKCFSVGMKKEWILNEEQLRRRKNSRLNNMQTQQRQKQQHQDMGRSQMIKAMSGPLSINPMEAQLGALNGRGTVVSTPLVSPTQGYPLVSPAGSIGSSDSPPSRPIGIMPGGQRSPDAYESNIMMQQRLLTKNVSPILDSRSNKVVLSMDEYHNLVQMAGNKATEEEPPLKRSAYSPTDLATPQPRPFPAGLLQGNMAAMRQQMAGMGSYMDIGSSAAGEMPKQQQQQYPPGYAEKMEKMNLYFDKTIEDALKIDSIDSPPQGAGQEQRSTAEQQQQQQQQNRCDSRLNYQLNATELRALDLVTEAFRGMNDVVEHGRQKDSALKDDKSPADIMNIMDITMRRLVKMAKKLPAFNDLSQDGKFALLKGGMVEMLTVRGVARFDPSKGAWKSPALAGNAEVSLNMFDTLNQSVRSEQKSRFMQFFEVFHADLRSNELAISLIMLIVLFSQRDVITNPEDRRQIAKNHDNFCNLLNRYLESLYGDDAHKLFERLPHALSMLKEISQNAGMLFIGTVNPTDTEALPREIFKVE